MKKRTGCALIGGMAALALSGCGSSAQSSSSTTNAAVASTTPTTTTSSSTTTTSAAKPKKKAPAAKPKKKQTSHTQTTTTSTTSTTTPTTTTTTTTHHTTTTPAIASLPAGYVSKSNSQMRVEFEGQGHHPKIKVKWEYFVEATNSKGEPLAGKVLTEFLFQGQVEGKEAPPYHNLKGGKLADRVTFPPESKSIPLTVQVVVTTKYGSLTLDWSVKPIK